MAQIREHYEARRNQGDFAGGVPYTGTPVPSGTSNSLNGGMGVGTMRVMAGYDRVLGTRMTLGTRVGFAFLGRPEKDGKTFLPIHAEARFAFYFNKDPFKEKGVRPYIFANGGVGEANARVSTTVVDDDGSGDDKQYKLDVYQKAGPAFGGAGVGLQYAVSPEAAMVVDDEDAGTVLSALQEVERRLARARG